MIAQEVLHLMESSKLNSTLMDMKLDMQWAYDWMSWEFVCRVLQKFGFADKWVGWIRACISLSAFTVLVNGENTD